MASTADSRQWTGNPFGVELRSPGNSYSTKSLRGTLPSVFLVNFVVHPWFSETRRLAMQEDHQRRGLLRFGVFELNLSAGELRKHGLRVQLQAQPFQVLVMLLEHQGEVVTREDIQKKVWQGDTFVDFDHGLNKAINKIRDALGDSAQNPRFVETVARRGYRFLAEVRVVEGTPDGNAGPAATAEPTLETGKQLDDLARNPRFPNVIWG